MAASKTLMRIISPRIMAAALQAFDRATLIVLAVCWLAFLMTMVFAIYTLKQSTLAKHDAESALVAEPDLPKMNKDGVDGHVAQAIVEKMQKLYPDITFTLDGARVIVSAVDAGKFHQWLTSLSYIDTVYPEYRWTITDFCVGKCPHGPIMQAAMTGERATFTLPH